MSDFDPVLVEVLKNDLTAVAEEMAITMKRTARSLVAKEGADFSTALTDARGNLIAQGLTIGIHLGYIAGVMPWVLDRYGASLRPGDVIASNDPYKGVSHFPDIVLIMPVFVHDQLVGVSAFSSVSFEASSFGGSGSERNLRFSAPSSWVAMILWFVSNSPLSSDSARKSSMYVLIARRSGRAPMSGL